MKTKDSTLNKLINSNFPTDLKDDEFIEISKEDAELLGLVESTDSLEDVLQDVNIC